MLDVVCLGSEFAGFLVIWFTLDDLHDDLLLVRIFERFGPRNRFICCGAYGCTSLETGKVSSQD